MNTDTKFKLKKLALTTGGIYIVVLHESSAKKLRLRTGDRVSLRQKYSSQKIIAILDTTSDESFIKKNQVGIFKELHRYFQKNTGLIYIQPKSKPSAVFAIQKKLHNKRLSKDEMYDIVMSITKNELTDIEMTYFVSACFANELSESEIVHLTNAMIESGETIQFPHKIVVDKHCIGGVAANRTTTLVVPILAAAGYCMPKTSSRSITSPAGTSDTMEVLTNVSLSAKQIKDVVKKTNGCLVWGGGLDLAPADDKIIRVEHPLSLDPQGQLVASILAKKKTVGATHVLIDIPVGKGAKIEKMQKAKKLQHLFVRIGKKLGMDVLAIITDGSQPIGNGIGPALEARDILWTLENSPKGSLQLKEKAINLSAQLINFITKKKDGQKIATEIFESQKAYDKFQKILVAQGAKIVDAKNISVGRYTHTVLSQSSGKVKHIDNVEISRIAKLLGAPFDTGAGVYLHVHKNDIVQKNQSLCTLYAQNKNKLLHVKEFVQKQNGFIVK